MKLKNMKQKMCCKRFLVYILEKKYILCQIIYKLKFKVFIKDEIKMSEKLVNVIVGAFGGLTTMALGKEILVI